MCRRQREHCIRYGDIILADQVCRNSAFDNGPHSVAAALSKQRDGSWVVGRSGGELGVNRREIDIRLCDVVDVVSQHIKRNVNDDFDHTGFVETRRAKRR